MTYCEPDSVFGACWPDQRSSWFCVQSFRGLSSIDSVEASVASLFVDVAGTTDSSKFLSAFMSDFPPEVFSDRSVVWCDCHPIKTETNRTSRFSRLEFPRMPRFADSAVSVRTLPERCARCRLLPVRTGSARERGDVGALWLARVALRTDA